MMTFNPLNQVREKKLLLKHTELRKIIEYATEVWQSSDSLENLRFCMCFAFQG